MESVLHFGLSAKPVTLDPRFATDAVSSRINRLLYRRLVEFGENFEPVPGLVDWQRTGPVSYRFELSTDPANFTNGDAISAADIKATLDYILDGDNGSPHRGALTHIKEVTVIGPRELEITLTKPDLLFPGRLNIEILPASLIASGHDFNHAPVGNGEFEFVSWESNDTVTLRRRRDGQLVAFVPVPDPTVRVLKLIRGEIDILQNDLPPELIDYLKARDEVYIVTGRGNNFAYLGFNLQDDTAGQDAIRRAITHAVDRQKIIRYMLTGNARPATGILAPDHWAGYSDADAIRYDPELARSILNAAGFGPGHRVHMIYKTSNDSFRLRVAQIIQQQLKEVGIDVEIKSYDWGTFYGDIKGGNFQMYSLMWVGIKLPDIYRYVFHSASLPPAGANRGRFVDARADRLIEAAERGETLEVQADYYRQLQQLLLERLPYVPLWYEDHVYAARYGVDGYRLAVDGNYDGLVDLTRH